MLMSNTVIISLNENGQVAFAFRLVLCTVCHGLFALPVGDIGMP